VTVIDATPASTLDPSDAFTAHCSRIYEDALERLLHNMSTPPKSVVKFEGLSDLVVHRQPGGSGVTAGSYHGQRFFGTPVRFELPAGWQRLSEAAILRQLDPTAKRCSPSVSETLAELIDRRAAALPLPGGCAVIPADPTHAMVWADALTALAVLAKCTDTVWLRDRTPSLASARERGPVSLLVPPMFASTLPKGTQDPEPRLRWVGPLLWPEPGVSSEQ
jgi:hypothetical protein